MKKFLSWLKKHVIDILLVFVITALIALITLSFFWTKDRQLKKVENLPNRFEIVEEFTIGSRIYRVIKDIGTNVLYLVGPEDIQLLVDYEGKPVTWDPYGG